MWNVSEAKTVFVIPVQGVKLFAVQFRLILQPINLVGSNMDRLLVEMDLKLLSVFKIKIL